MRYLIIFSGAICLSFMLLPACAPQAEQPAEPVAEEAPSTEADVEAIRALLDKDATVIASGDLDGWVDLFTDDVVCMPPNAALLEGKDAVRAFGQVFFDQFNMEFAITVDEIEVHGNWAFARWHYDFDATPKSGGETLHENGKEIWIFKRQSDGSWKCSHVIWNTDNPPPEEPTT